MELPEKYKKSRQKMTFVTYDLIPDEAREILHGLVNRIEEKIYETLDHISWTTEHDLRSIWPVDAPFFVLKSMAKHEIEQTVMISVLGVHIDSVSRSPNRSDPLPVIPWAWLGYDDISEIRRMCVTVDRAISEMYASTGGWADKDENDNTVAYKLGFSPIKGEGDISPTCAASVRHRRPNNVTFPVVFRFNSFMSDLSAMCSL